jgi:hypothetical protein
MNRKALSLIVILALVSLNLFAWPARMKSIASVAPVGPDLYIKDTSADTGIEANPDTGPMWISEDIWVRTTPDPNYQPFPFPEASPPWTPLPNENPEYRDPKFSVPNYVYVRVRNRGTSASTGTERLRLYFAKASTGLSWPTQWGGAGVDYVAGDCGPTKLFGAEVTKPRKNAATATLAERNAYRDAILNIGQSAFVFPSWGGLSYWHKQQQAHRFGPSNRHHTPAFLAWHREFINRYEALLQESNPTVKLLYWDWTTDPEPSAGFSFYPGFMGTSGRGGSSSVSIAAPFNPGAGTTLAPPSVTRRLNSGAPPAIADTTILGNTAFGAPLVSGFANSLELDAHDGSHGYIGGFTGSTGFGDMTFINLSTQDPFFFLLHANVDRLWAKWQRDPSALSRLDPATAYDLTSSNANITTSMRPWDGTGSGTGLIAPWTSGGGMIVSKTPTHPSVISPPIYDDAPLVIPVLQPGEAVVIQIPWYPPNPADFGCFGDPGHFCLLGRIETSTSTPFGMATVEGADVNANTRNNNNIAWKNVTVVDNFAGALLLSSALIRNTFKERIQTNLHLAAARDFDASFFQNGRVLIMLPPEILKRWRGLGGKGEGIKYGGDADRGLIEIRTNQASIENIPLEPGEVFPVTIQFAPGKDYQRSRTKTLRYDLIQTGSPRDPVAVIGGVRFEVDLTKLVLVKPGSEWRYQDAVARGWTSSDFDDSKWKTGHAELGFGDDPMTTIDGGPAGRRRITTYFRRSFDVADPAFFQSLVLRLKRDDGAVVYLNGKQIHRVNLPAGAISPSTLATRDVSGLEEEVFYSINVDPATLVRGRNLVAVEVHQSSPRSDDLSFDLELLANLTFKGFSPDIAFTSMRNGELFQKGEPIPINVQAIDGDGKITGVSVFADGKLLARSEKAPFTFVWRDAPLGVHRLHAVALDGDQQTGVVDLTVNVVENVPPAVSLLQPSDGAVFRPGQPITVVAPASDRLGKIDRVEFFVREADLFISKERLVGTAKEPPFTITIRDLPRGRYMLTAVAWDNGGLPSPSIPIHFTVGEEMHR